MVVVHEMNYIADSSAHPHPMRKMSHRTSHSSLARTFSVMKDQLLVNSQDLLLYVVLDQPLLPSQDLLLHEGQDGRSQDQLCHVGQTDLPQN